jgi:predicted RNase H-like HicB family nuclease
MLEQAVHSHVVRKHFSQTINNVIRKGPTVIKRNSDHVVMMNPDHVSMLLQNYRLSATVEKDEHGEYIASCNEIEDFFITGKSPEESIHNLANELVGYAQEYMDDFNLYYHSPNRKHHFPYMFKVLLQNSVEDVAALIHVQQ